VGVSTEHTDDRDRGLVVLGAIALARSARRAPLPDLEAVPALQLQRASIQSSAPRHSESR